MQREKLWTPEFLGMGGSNLFLFMSQYIMVAALPIFIMDTLGGDDGLPDRRGELPPSGRPHH